MDVVETIAVSCLRVLLWQVFLLLSGYRALQIFLLGTGMVCIRNPLIDPPGILATGSFILRMSKKHAMFIERPIYRTVCVLFFVLFIFSCLYRRCSLVFCLVVRAYYPVPQG